MIDMQDVKFEGLKLAADWIRDLESSDSRLHKEKVIEKALMASKLGMEWFVPQSHHQRSSLWHQ